MQAQLGDIEQILSNKDNIDLDSVGKSLENLKNKIEEIQNKSIKDLDEIITNAKQGNGLNNATLYRIQEKMKKLENTIEELNKNGTQIQETNVQGALKLTEEAKEKADRALHKAERSQVSFYLFVIY